MLILITNDDGYDQPGLLELHRTLKREHELFSVAPLHHCSGASQSLGLYSSMELRATGRNSWSLEGTPTDCVKIALMEVMKGRRRDLVISGINPGANLANNIFYSGTVAAATEAALWDIPSIAVSVSVNSPEEPPAFRTASRVLAEIMEHGLHQSIPHGAVLNVNVPELEYEELSGYRWTRMGRFADDIAFRQLEPGRVFSYDRYCALPVTDPSGSDVEAVENGFVSLTLLNSDRTLPHDPVDTELTRGGA